MRRRVRGEKAGFIPRRDRIGEVNRGGKVAALDYWKEGGGGGGSDERVDDDGEERRGVWEDGAPGGRSAPLDLRVREGGRLRSSF